MEWGVDYTDKHFEREMYSQRLKMLGFAIKLRAGKSDADVEDMVQDAMLTAWKYRLKFIPGTSMGAWCCTILKNYYLSSLKLHGGRVRVAEVGDIEFEYLAEPEKQDDQMYLKQVEAAVARLPAHMQPAFKLVTIEGLDYNKVAETLGIPVGTVKSKVFRARAELQLILADPKNYVEPGRGLSRDKPKL